MSLFKSIFANKKLTSKKLNEDKTSQISDVNEKKLDSVNLVKSSSLNKNPSFITKSIASIFSTKKKIDEQILEDLMECLIIADVGYDAANKIIDSIRKNKINKNADISEIKNLIASQIIEILKPVEKKLILPKSELKNKINILLFCGVNGSGKTTTIGKIAKKLSNEGQKVMLAACDSFRAAAVAQLEVWAERSGCLIEKANKQNEDPAAIAYRSLQKAKQENCNIVLIDTAGRLQNKKNLMDELAKINRVIKKFDAEAPHEKILVLDSTIGQNSLSQIKTFDEIIGLTGVIMTKLDSSAKGGVLVSIAAKYCKPVLGIGVGEQIENLEDFNAKKFAQALVGI